MAAVNTAGLCGFSDWRLPEVEELYSPVDQSIAFPGRTIDTGYFPNTIASWYWSSSPYAANAIGAWGVGFYYGGDDANGKSGNSSLFVLFAVESGYRVTTMFDFPAVYRAYTACRRGKRASHNTQRYEVNLLDHLVTTSQALQSRRWQPARSVLCF